ncbi:hypothetical protein ACOMHN_038943 [Nucella lapillus]
MLNYGFRHGDTRNTETGLVLPYHLSTTYNSGAENPIQVLCTEVVAKVCDYQGCSSVEEAATGVMTYEEIFGLATKMFLQDCFVAGLDSDLGLECPEPSKSDTKQLERLAQSLYYATHEALKTSVSDDDKI